MPAGRARPKVVAAQDDALPNQRRFARLWRHLHALPRAGKQVAVLVELKARCDERNSSGQRTLTEPERSGLWRAGIENPHPKTALVRAAARRKFLRRHRRCRTPRAIDCRRRRRPRRGRAALLRGHMPRGIKTHRRAPQVLHDLGPSHLREDCVR